MELTDPQEKEPASSPAGNPTEEPSIPPDCVETPTQLGHISPGKKVKYALTPGMMSLALLACSALYPCVCWFLAPPTHN